MSFAIKRIDHVQIAAPKGKETEAREFYSGLLGFEEIEKPPVLKARGGAWFRSGDVQVHIGVEEPFSPAKKAHPAFEVKGLEALREQLKKNGVHVIDDDNLPGATRFYAFDPFGNRLEFLQWQ
ncbi:VOC family protein [Bacillus sp. B-jedd]|uniref:VOC family protein n=1 Tax=Bacillus sp. B-jedd TaxID=1476857 RepID=UPI0005156084|nr:VOC family protein [Bacillus sp. B-jedd]CEG26987.1 Glyoxalase/bleomycin resistance protein/dioxygenase [Bacillus sp. B-jedd]